MTVEYDVIVVGSGPAGSIAAATAAQHGLKTLLVDRATFPRDKTCGDAVPLSCAQFLHKIGYTIPTEPAFFPINSFIIRGPRGGAFQHPLTQEGGLSSYIVPRLIFDAALHQFALSRGVSFEQLTVTAPILEAGRVVGVTGKQGKVSRDLGARVVIAADGATSAIARHLGNDLQREDKAAVALRAYIDTDVDLDPTIDFAFLDKIQPGYAWFFPLGKRSANIGVGMRSDHYKRQSHTLKDALAYYCQRPEIKRVIGQHQPREVKTWQLPLFDVHMRRCFDGALLVGDAGGFIDPIAGSGIRTAVITGWSAAEASAKAIQRNDVSAAGLSTYDTLWQSHLLKDLQRASTLHELLSKLPILIDAFILLARLYPALTPKLLGKV